MKKKILAIALSLFVSLSVFSVVGLAEGTRVFEEIFNVNFNGMVNNTPVSSGDVFLQSYSSADLGSTQASKDLVKNSSNQTYSNMFAYWGGSVEISNHISDDNLCAKMTVPNTNANSSVIVYAFIGKDQFPDIVNEPFALSFKAKIPSNSTFACGSRGVTSSEETANHTIFQTVNGEFKLYDYVPNSTNGANTTINSGYMVPDNEFFQVKIIVDPEDGTYDCYVNDTIIGSDVHFRGASSFHYFSIQFKHNGNPNIVGYLDDFKVYTLRESDIDAQITVNKQGNGTVKSLNDITSFGGSQTFTITPSEDSEIKTVTYNGVPVTGLNKNGDTYTVSSIPETGGTLNVVFSQARTFSKVFDVNFNGSLAGTAIMKDQLLLQSYKSASEGSTSKSTTLAKDSSNKTYTNMFAYWGASVEIKERSTGDLYAKLNIPNVDANTNILIYTFIGKDDFPDLVSEPFALSFKLQVPDNIYLKYSGNGINESGSVLGTTYMEIKNNKVYFYDYTSPTSYNAISSDYISGKLTDFKFVFDPQNDKFDCYIDNQLTAENVHMAEGNSMYYLAMQIKHNNEPNVVAYFDDYRCYSLREKDLKAQVNIEKTGNGSITTDKFVSAYGDTVTLNILPDEGCYIKNILFNSVPIGAFNATGTAFTTTSITDSAANVEVEFGTYNGNAPEVMLSPLKIKTSIASYIFSKLMPNQRTVDSYGILFSRTNSNLVNGADDTEIIEFDETLTINNKGINSNGYYGFEFVNNTGKEQVSYYVRPYARIGEIYYLGDIQYINTEVLSLVE